MDDFYAARSRTIPPLPWSNFAPPISQFPEIASDCWDGYAAAVVAEAGVSALKSGQRAPVNMIAKPEFYA